MPQQDADASQVYEAEKVLGVSLVPSDQASVVLKPREQTLDLPTFLVAAQGPPILGGSPLAAATMRADEFDPPFVPKPRVQRVAVVGAVANQAVGGMLEETVVDRLLREGDLMWRSTCNPDGDRKTSAVCNGHDLGPLATLRLSDGRAPFLAPAKVPSMKASLMSIPPRS